MPITRNEKLVAAVKSVQAADDAERAHQESILQFLARRDEPFSRQHLDAHLTASAIVVDCTGERVLLGLHRKIGRWLQLGGHGNPGEAGAEEVAAREAFEESGIAHLQLHAAAPGPIDVDIHKIPARAEVPAHLHLDIRYLFVAPENAVPLPRAEEHLQLCWFSWGEALDGRLDLDAALKRALNKARKISAGSIAV
jgi:8-oxo-dGTP pyrophosphatase MutT (NUDIX family)